MEEVIKQYTEKTLQTSVKKMAPYRKQWLIETSSDSWIAKRIKQQRSPMWLVKINEELRHRGFLSMPTLKTDGKEWVYSSFVDGKSANYSNIQEVSKLMTTLAQFHLAGERIFSPSKKPTEFLIYHRLYRRLVQFYHIVNNAHQLEGELGNLIRAHGKDFYLDGLRAWEKLQSSPLRQLTDQERESGNLAHRDLASHNWVIDLHGEPWLIDWDTADYDLQLGDLWQMSMRILTQNNWEESWVRNILVHYEEIRPLSSVERSLLYQMFGFPNEFYREVIGLAHRKRGFKEKNVLLYLKRIIFSRDSWRSQLKQLGGA